MCDLVCNVCCVFLFQGSAGFPSVLESSQISTENGQRSRFPRPEMEISFSPLQPNRLALRRQGEQDSVTVKISHSRKRRSNDIDRVRSQRNTLGHIAQRYSLGYIVE